MISLERMPAVLPGAGDEWLQEYRREQQRANAAGSKRIVLFPIIFFQIYLLVSVLVFAFGPWPWPVSNPVELYSFLILAQLALFLGYRSALNQRARGSRINIKVKTAVILSLSLNFLWIGTTFKSRTGQTTFSLGAAVSAVNTGLRNPGSQYDERQQSEIMSGDAASTPMGYVTLMLYPVMWLAFPLGIFFWKQLSATVRFALVVWIIVDLTTWIAGGTNKGIADLVLLLPSMLVARNPAMLTKIRAPNLRVLAIAFLGFASLLLFFSGGISGRGGGAGDPLYEPSARISADTENLTLKFFPERVQVTLASFASYFGQGYYALSLTLNEPFVFCYGVGNSYFLEGLSRHFVSEPIASKTYPARIEEQGWDSYGKWHSIYPWIASDLTFPGTLVFMLVVGRLFALVWLDVAFCRNPWAVCLLPLVLMMLFYAPGNNQVLAFSSTALPFWALLTMWVLSRNRARAN